VVAALLTGLSIAVPAAIMVFIYPLNHDGFHYVNGRWRGEIWWSYVYIGMAVSIGLGLAGIVLAARSKAGAYRTPEGQDVKSRRGLITPARVPQLFTLLVLIFGSAAFIVIGIVTHLVPIGDWIALVLLGVSLACIAVMVRSAATAASLVLPVAVVALIMGQLVGLDVSHSTVGRLLIGAGVVGIAVAAWGISASDLAVTRRWLLPFTNIAFVLALLGNVHMCLFFAILGFLFR
jgi:hypothetical protein